MPSPKKTSSPAKKERIVPVRVVKTAPKADAPEESQPVAVTPQSAKRQRPAPQMSSQRKLMWGGVIGVSILVFAFWVLFTTKSLTASSNSNDSFFSRIWSEVKDVLNSFSLPSSENTNDQELNELRNSVFPDIKVDDSATNSGTDAAANANSDATTDVNSTNTTP